MALMPAMEEGEVNVGRRTVVPAAGLEIRGHEPRLFHRHEPDEHFLPEFAGQELACGRQRRRFTPAAEYFRAVECVTVRFGLALRLHPGLDVEGESGVPDGREVVLVGRHLLDDLIELPA